jgi:hypothetical protein
MPRPRELFDAGDPITADFAYIHRLGDRKRIEEITKVWNKLVIGRTAEMEEWIPAMQKMLKRRLTIYAYFNNHMTGSVPRRRGYSARCGNEWPEKRMRKSLVPLKLESGRLICFETSGWY